jgi:hypothetical protein
MNARGDTGAERQPRAAMHGNPHYIDRGFRGGHGAGTAGYWSLKLMVTVASMSAGSPFTRIGS